MESFICISAANTTRFECHVIVYKHCMQNETAQFTSVWRFTCEFISEIKIPPPNFEIASLSIHFADNSRKRVERLALFRTALSVSNQWHFLMKVLLSLSIQMFLTTLSEWVVLAELKSGPGRLWFFMRVEKKKILVDNFFERGCLAIIQNSLTSETCTS